MRERTKGEKRESKEKKQKSTHPVRRPGRPRLLDGPLDALEGAVKVQRPLVEVAGRERGDAARHVEFREER